MKIFNYRSVLFFPLIFVLLFSVSCSDDPVSKNYYTFSGETVSSYLQKSDKFSDFVEILKRANKLELLSTYGEYTCFAPTNTAISNYLSTSGLSSISSLTDKDCDTIARTHLVKGAYFIANLSEGALPTANMLDRYLTLSSDSDVSNNNKLIYLINKTSKLIVYDDSVTNGVVHTVDKVITSNSDFLSDFIANIQGVSLFSSALSQTGMKDSLQSYIDPNYTVLDELAVTDGVYYHCGNEYEYAYYPKKRYLKYTAFVEPDSIYHLHHIYTLDDLKAYAKSIYDATYPDDAGLYDNDPTNRKNPLNRFVSYHLLDRMGNYNEWNITGTLKSECNMGSLVDATDFFETMCPGTIMKISSPSEGLFINRKGVGSSYTVRGVKVLAPSEVSFDQNALNGIVHYLDDILVYDVTTRDVVFNTRFRIDATTTSPDFMNSGARGKTSLGSSDHTSGFWAGSLKNWKFNNSTFVALRLRHPEWNSYEGDAVAIEGIFDISVKLPPVPDGTYQVRLSISAMSTRGVVQVYLNNKPCGIPVDMRVVGTDPSIGWVADVNAGASASDKAVDKAMRNRGYYKGPNSYGRYTSTGLILYRDESTALRIVLATTYLSSTQDNYLRFRQVLDDPKSEFPFDYLELCPKSIYDNEDGEDLH